MFFSLLLLMGPYISSGASYETRKTSCVPRIRVFITFGCTGICRSVYREGRNENDITPRTGFHSDEVVGADPAGWIAIRVFRVKYFTV